jgi:diguanylate cyclase (GGDEF)-like protein/PAS domain S-box-containing protein
MRTRGWLWFLLLAIAAATVYGLLPVTIWKEPLYIAIVTVCVVAALLGIVVHRPSAPLPWYLLLGGIAGIAVAEWIWFFNDLRGISPFPSWSEYFDLSGRILLLGGIALLATRRGEHRDRTAIVDFVAFGVVIGTVVWVVAFREYFDRADLWIVERLVTFSYLTLDLAILVGFGLLLLRSRGGSPSLRLLTAGVAVLLGTDILWLVLEVHGHYSSGHLLDIGWPIACACVAAAALHHTMNADVAVAPRRPTFAQALAFGAAVAALPMMDLLLDASQVNLTLLDHVGLGACALIIAICVMIRFVGVVRLTGDVVAAQASRRMEALVRESQDVIAIIGADRRSTYVSPAIERVLGWSPGIAVGLPLETLVYPEDRARVVEYFDEAVTAGHPGPLTYEMRVTTADGAGALMEIVAVNRIDDPDIRGFVLTGRDITDRRRLEEEVAYQAFHDALTGLANRRLLLDHVTLAINNRREEHAPASAVVVIDLDDFKSLNEELGHAAGDDLLLAIAERLNRCVRPGDTVARLAGDEFALLLLDAHPDALDEVATRMLEILGLPLHAGTTEVATSASIGIRMLRSNDTAQLAVRDADIAMYSAKTSGKGRYAIFDLEMGAQTERRLALKADLRGAWRRGEISVAFQPIVDIADGRLRGAEALMRWMHPLYGAVSPVEFVALAEETGIIRTLGLEVLREATHQAARWRERSAPTFYISVNVSPVQLDGQFVRSVEEILSATGLDPRALVLEVTEGVLVTDFGGSVAILQALRDRGIRIAIDDFGTGYASLSYARHLPVDLVKIDRSFTSDLGKEGPSIVPTVMQLAETLRAAVVAEGIETEDQADLLVGLECTLGQGHLYAPALPEATFRDLVRAGHVPRTDPLTASRPGRGARSRPVA